MVRVPPAETDELVAREHIEPMVMAGRETRGWLRVSEDGLKTTRPEIVGQLRRRLRQGLPPK